MDDINTTLKLISSPFSWIVNKSKMAYWKHNKKWPIELKYTGESPEAIYHSHFLEIGLALMIRVKEKNPKFKIDGIKVRLVGNNHIYDVSECTWGDAGEYSRFKDKRIGDLAEAQGQYSLLFKEPLTDDYFKNWCKGNISETVSGTVILRTGEFECESNKFLVIGTEVGEGDAKILA